MEKEPRQKPSHRRPGRLKRFGSWLISPFTRQENTSAAAPTQPEQSLPPILPYSTETAYPFVQPEATPLEATDNTSFASGYSAVQPPQFSSAPVPIEYPTAPPLHPDYYSPFMADPGDDDESSPWPDYHSLTRHAAPFEPHTAELAKFSEPVETWAPDIDTTAVVATFEPRGKAITYRNAHGEDLVPPVTYKTTRNAENAFEILSGLLLGAAEADGSPIHLGRAAEAMQRRKQALGIVMANLAKRAPEGAITLDHAVQHVTFGNLTVATQIPPPHQRWTLVSAQEPPISTQEAVPLEVAETPEVTAEDEGKIDLTEFDHMRIDMPERTFLLPLSTPAAILAARCIEALVNNRPTGEGTLNNAVIAGLAWEAMPQSEREIFADGHKPSLKDTKGWPIRPGVVEVLRSLTNRMKLTREPHDREFKVLAEAQVSFSEETPDQGFINDDNTALLFPPGTKRIDIIEYKEPITVQESDREIASTLIGYIETMFPGNNEQGLPRPDITQETAIEYLSFITSRSGKAAIKEMLTAAGSSRRPDGLIRVVRRRIIKPALREGYGDAWRHRTIAGGHMTGAEKGARQTGGRLEGSTTKWHVGTRHDDGRAAR